MEHISSLTGEELLEGWQYQAKFEAGSIGRVLLPFG